MTKKVCENDKNVVYLMPFLDQGELSRINRDVQYGYQDRNRDIDCE